MEATIVEGDLEVQARIPGKRSLIDGELEAFFDGRNVFLGDVATNDFGFEDEARADFAWLDGVVDLRELTGTTRLFLVGVAIGNWAW